MEFSHGDENSNIIGIAVTKEEFFALAAGMMAASVISPNEAIKDLAATLSLEHIRMQVK